MKQYTSVQCSTVLSVVSYDKGLGKVQRPLAPHSGEQGIGPLLCNHLGETLQFNTVQYSTVCGLV